MGRIKKTIRVQMIKSIAEVLCAFTGGFIFSVSDIVGLVSFADISLAGALSLPFAVAVLIGAIVRCVLTDTVGKSIVKLAAMTVIVIAKMFSERSNKPKGSGIVTIISVLIAGTAVSLLINEFPQKLFFYVVYGSVSGFVSYSLAMLISDFRKHKVININSISGCTYSIVYIVYIASLFSMSFANMNFGLVLAALLTVMSSFYYHSLGGIICGSLSACGAFFVSNDLGITASVLPVAGLIAGFMKIRRATISAAFFSFLCFVIAVLTSSDITMEATFGIICGTAIFIIIAPYYSDKWVSVENEKSTEFSDINSIRLNFLSDAIEAVRLDAIKISAILSTDRKQQHKQLNPRKKVCDSCYRRSICQANNMETAGDMIPILPESCVHKKEVAEELEKKIRTRATEQLMKLRFADERELLDEQLKVTGEIVRFAGERTDIRYSTSKSNQIMLNLENHGMNPKNVTAYYNSANRLIAEIYFDIAEIPENRVRICDLVSDDLQINFCVSLPVSSSKEMRICLYEKPKHEIEIYSASVCAEDSDISGDSAAFFADTTGINYIILSDGMGSGKNAAVDSHLVIGMFRRLICGGMEYKSAVKLINSIMVTKSREESFATLDVIRIDLDRCNVTSIKSGAAATIIRRRNDVIKISSPTFPIGITKQAELYISEHGLNANDMIIMFSDGINENAYLFIKELLLNNQDIKKIVQEITSKADIFNPSLHSDDVTVIGIKIKSNEN